MGCPAGMGNTQMTVRLTGQQGLLQLCHFAHGARTSNAIPIGQYGNTSGIITTVFEATQAFDQDGGDIAQCNCANDSTHFLSIFLAFRHLARGGLERTVICSQRCRRSYRSPANTSDLKHATAPRFAVDFLRTRAERTFLTITAILHCETMSQCWRRFDCAFSD